MERDVGGAAARPAAAAPAPGPASPPASPPGPGAPSTASSGDELAGEIEAELARTSGEGSPIGGDGGSGGPAKKRARDEDGGAAAAAAAPPPPAAAVCPPHPGSMGGICVRCGAAVPADEVEGSVALRYIHGGLRLHADEAARVRAAATTASTAGRRLHLVLDLDHTLLNSTRLDEVPPALRPGLDAIFRAEDEAVARAVAREAEVKGGEGEATAAKKQREDGEGGGGGGCDAAAAAAAPPPPPPPPPPKAAPSDPRRRPTAAAASASAPSTSAPPADPRRRGGSAAPPSATAPPPAQTDPRRRAAVPPPRPPRPHPLRTIFSLPDIGLITKLRPGLRAFLAGAHERYELVVYTHGDRAYARAMARLLDPDGTLFGGRVISQADSTVSHAKSLDVVLGQEKATLILDDTAGVWPGHAANLIQVERYIYFPACAGRFGTGRPSLLEAGRDEVPDLATLASVGRVLAAVHARVFKGGDAASAAADVRDHLAAERAAVLAGCVLVLSGCAPLGTDAASSPVGRVAASLGARIEAAVVPGETTHVVAAVDGTAKAAAGRAAGAAVVGADWVYSALFLWRRAPEARFPPPIPAAVGGGGGGGAGAGAAPPAAQRTEAEDVAAAAAAAGGGRGGGGEGGEGGRGHHDDGRPHIDGVL